MSPGLASLQEIAAVHDLRFGEIVTYSATGLQINATVNRKPGGGWKQDGLAKQPQLLAAGYSEVTVLESVMPDAPVAGQYFKDNANKTHRIQEVSHTGFAWTCLCKVGAVV